MKGAIRDRVTGHPLNSFANAESKLFLISSVRILSPADAKGSMGLSVAMLEDLEAIVKRGSAEPEETMGWELSSGHADVLPL